MEQEQGDFSVSTGAAAPLRLFKKTTVSPSMAQTKFTGTTDEPMDPDAPGSYFRIPSLVTLSNGWLMATSDVRWYSTNDSPNNLDTIVSISKDGGNTWDYEVINYFADYVPTKQLDQPYGPVKNAGETFLGVCPDRGFVADNGRIIFPVYDNITGPERASVIYSDDNGKTWTRGGRTNSFSANISKTSESQIIRLPDGTLRMYSRNQGSAYVGYSDSTDNGAAWGTTYADTGLRTGSNCMFSVINVAGALKGPNGESYENTEGSHCGVCGEVLVAQKEVPALGSPSTPTPTTTTVTDSKTGAVTETARKEDGTVETVETRKDGTVTATATAPRGGSQLDPRSSASRAEVATMLRRFVELIK